MDMQNNDKLNSLLAQLPGSRALSALELNDIRFSGRKTVITPGRLKSSRRK